MPFSVKAAQNFVWATGGNFDDGEGEYNVYTIQADSNGYLQFYFDDQFYSFNQYRTAVATKIDLNNKYSGDIVLTFDHQTTYTVFPLYWADCNEGSVGIDGVNNQFILHLNNVQHLTFYVCSTATSTNNIQPGTVEPNNLVITADYYDTLSSYQIPIESVPAYIFTTSNPNDIIYNFGDAYPHYHVLSGTVGQTVRFYSLDRNQHYYYVFFTKDTISANANPPRTFTLNRSNTVSMTIGAVNPYTASSYRLYLAEFTVPSDSALNEIRWGFETDVYPVFFGYYSQMPDSIRQLCNLTTTQGEILDALRNQNITLTQIYNLLFNTTDTSQSIQDTADAVDDLIDEEHDITDGFMDDLTGFNTDMDLTQYNFTSLFMDANNYFKNQLDTMYTESSGFRGYWIIPIILVILTVLLGR